MNNRGKLLTAFVAVAMIVCVFAALAPATDAAEDKSFDITDADSILKSTADGVTWSVSDDVITINENTVWNLTKDVTLSIGQINLNGKTLTIKGADLTVNGSADKNLISVQNTSTQSKLAVDGASLTLNSFQNAHQVLVNTQGSNKGLEISGSNGATIVLNKTGDSSAVGTGTGNTVFNLNGSSLSVTGNGSIQSSLFKATSSTITANIGSASIAGYFVLNGTTVSASNVNVYAADLKSSSITASANLGVYGGDKSSAFSSENSLTIKTVKVDAKSSVSADTIHAGLYDAVKKTYTAAGDVSFTGEGSVAGEFTTDVSAVKNIALTTVDISGSTFTKNVTVSGTATVSNDAVTFNDGSKVGASGLTVSNVVDKVTNSVEFKNGAIFKGFTLSAGSIIMNGKVVDTTNGVKITGEAKVVGDTVIDGPIEMADGSSLTVPEGTKLTAKEISGTGSPAATPVVSVLGDMEMTDTTSQNNVSVVELTVGANGNYDAKLDTNVEVTYDPQSGEFQFGDTLRSDYTVTYNEYLSQNLTIPAGVTLTIASTGNLNLAGYNIILYGTIVVEGNGTIAGIGSSDSSKTCDTIFLMRGGSVENNGIIGTDKPVTVSADPSKVVSDAGYKGTGSVSMSNVSGVTFTLANTSDGTNASYVLSVSGSFQTEGAGDIHTVAINGARLTGDVYVGQDVDVTFNGNNYLMGSATLTVDGSVAVSSTGSKLIMKYNSTLVANGPVTGTVTAETGVYESSKGTYDTAGLTSVTTFKQAISQPAATKDNYYVYGYTLTVRATSYQENNVAMTSQDLYVSGALSYGAVDGTYPDQNTAGTVAVDGTVIVADETTFVLAPKMTVTGTVKVLGEVQFTTGASVTDYIGASYKVTVTTPTRSTTTYIVPFEDAMAAIDTADNKTVTLKGEIDIVSDVTLAAGQRLNITDATVTIDEDAEMTVEQRASVTGAIAQIDGVLTVINGGSCTPAQTSYATRTTGTNADGVGFTRYSGLAAAIANASEGDTIQVVNPVKTKDLSVPAGITVSAKANIDLSGNLVIAETAKLVMTDNAKLSMTGERSTITVNGELDAKEGSVVFTQNKDTNALTSMGTTTLAAGNPAFGNVKVNAVSYTNEFGQTVLTNAEAAIAAASAQDVNKKVTVLGTVNAGDLNLTVDMTVSAGANADFGTVTVADGIAVTVNGKLSATVLAKTGVAGSETDSTVTLAKASGITVGAGKVTDNQNVTTYQLYISGTLAGSATVSAGTAVVGSAAVQTLTVDAGTENAVLTVAEGATLQVNGGMTLNVGEASNDAAAVVVNGTLVADKGTVNVGFNDKDGYMAVSGTFTVADETRNVIVAEGSELAVTGTLAVSTTENKAGSVTVYGLLTVGEKITTMGGSTAGTVTGAIDTAGTTGTVTGIVKAYNGADVSGALIDVVGGESQADSLAMYVNGNLYMTLYSEGASINDAFLTSEEFAIVGYEMTVSGTNGYDIKDLSGWYTDADMSAKLPDNTNSVEIGGAYDALYFKVNSSVVDVKVSIGAGISLYIDNIRYNTGDTAHLSVGQHTVSASVNPGYTGTVTVQFNGATVSGSFTITPEMASNAYEGTVSITATGDISQDSTVVVDGGSSGDSGMGLTDYLLIVLVVLIVIMAIIVAMRLMRS